MGARRMGNGDSAHAGRRAVTNHESERRLPLVFDFVFASGIGGGGGGIAPSPWAGMYSLSISSHFRCRSRLCTNACSYLSICQQALRTYGQARTYWALVKTTAIDSELHRNKFGAITSARLGAVILVIACTFSSRKSCKKLTTNRTTRRLMVGRRWTI